MADLSLQADSAPVIPALSSLNINGVVPFWSSADAADERLEEVHALLTVLTQAYQVCEAASVEAADPLMTLRPGITAKALEGVATLVALAKHCDDVAHAEHSGRS